MNDTGPTSPAGPRGLLQVTPATVQRLDAVWRVGQTLNAVVRESSPGGVQLGIGANAINARTELQLQQGQSLQLQVATVSPQVTLRVLQPPTTAMLMADMSRSLLPRQAPQAQVVQSLMTVLANNPSALPEDVRVAARALLDATPTPGSVSRPDQLQTALANSGLFLESKLLAAPGNPGAAAAALAGDGKSLLANLLQTLFGALSSRPRSWQGGEQAPPNARRFVPLNNPGGGTILNLLQGMAQAANQGSNQATAQNLAQNPAQNPAQAMIQQGAAGARLAPPSRDPGGLLTELARQTDGALARIQLTQVNLLTTDNQLPWLFELPVRDGNRADQLQLLLDQETDDRDGERGKVWTVRVSLDFPETGPLHCTVALQGQSVSTSWWAERRTTALQVNELLGGLSERINALGLSVTGMRCVHGRPPEPAAESAGQRGGSLFDEHV